VPGGGVQRGSDRRQDLPLPPQGVRHALQGSPCRRQRHRAALLPAVQQVTRHYSPLSPSLLLLHQHSFRFILSWHFRAFALLPVFFLILFVL